jgi:hypothetical protein
MWRGSVPSGAGLRLQDMLDWNVLLRASILRTQSSSWVGIAAKLSVHEHTLARSAKRLAGLTLRELAAAGADQVVQILEERALAPVLSPNVEHAA